MYLIKAWANCHKGKRGSYPVPDFQNGLQNWNLLYIILFIFKCIEYYLNRQRIITWFLLWKGVESDFVFLIERKNYFNFINCCFELIFLVYLNTCCRSYIFNSWNRSVFNYCRVNNQLFLVTYFVILCLISPSF